MQAWRVEDFHLAAGWNLKNMSVHKYAPSMLSISFCFGKFVRLGKHICSDTKVMQWWRQWLNIFCSLPGKASSTHSIRVRGRCGRDPAAQCTAGEMWAARFSVIGIREGACWASPAQSGLTGTLNFPTSLKETNTHHF